MKYFFTKEERGSLSWGQILWDFFEIIRGVVISAVHEKQVKVLKVIIAILCITLGLLFFLNGAALFAGNLINGNSWSGYMSVGTILVIVGIFLPKR